MKLKTLRSPMKNIWQFAFSENLLVNITEPQLSIKIKVRYFIKANNWNFHNIEMNIRMTVIILFIVPRRSSVNQRGWFEIPSVQVLWTLFLIVREYVGVLASNAGRPFWIGRGCCRGAIVKDPFALDCSHRQTHVHVALLLRILT